MSKHKNNLANAAYVDSFASKKVGSPAKLAKCFSPKKVDLVGPAVQAMRGDRTPEQNEQFDDIVAKASRLTWAHLWANWCDSLNEKSGEDKLMYRSQRRIAEKHGLDFEYGPGSELTIAAPPTPKCVTDIICAAIIRCEIGTPNFWQLLQEWEEKLPTGVFGRFGFDFAHTALETGMTWECHGGYNLNKLLNMPYLGDLCVWLSPSGEWIVDGCALHELTVENSVQNWFIVMESQDGRPSIVTLLPGRVTWGETADGQRVPMPSVFLVIPNGSVIALQPDNQVSRVCRLRDLFRYSETDSISPSLYLGLEHRGARYELLGFKHYHHAATMLARKKSSLNDSIIGDYEWFRPTTAPISDWKVWFLPDGTVRQSPIRLPRYAHSFGIDLALFRAKTDSTLGVVPYSSIALSSEMDEFLLPTLKIG